MTDDLRRHIDEAMTRAAAQLGKGRVADYIPALAKVDPGKLGFALALPDGTVHASGDADEPFSIQSVSKVFTLALALRRVGSSLWDSVGREPSGSAFNSIVQLESEQGIPRNPLINAGALATTDRLIDGREHSHSDRPALRQSARQETPLAIEHRDHLARRRQLTDQRVAARAPCTAGCPSARRSASARTTAR